MSVRVVINPTYGLFILSDEAIRLLRQMGYYGYPHSIPRHDWRLIRVVEQLGTAAHNQGDELEIVGISGCMYRVCEYDGMEWVETPESIKWIYVS